MELDTSLYHPLDHTIFENQCWKYHGGPWNHFKLNWNYILIPSIKTRFFCQRGKHEVVMATNRAEGTCFKICINCHKNLET